MDCFQPMHVIVDQDVPDAVALYLKARGHQVELHREVFPLKTPDPVIAKRAHHLRAVVATWNCRHFRTLLLRHKSDPLTHLKSPESSVLPGRKRNFERSQR